MPNVGLGKYNPEIMATPCRSAKCPAGVGDRCKNTYGQDTPPHKIRKRDAMEQRGLYRKFTVRRNDGRDKAGGDKDNAKYFVLDYWHDPYARVALSVYADACESTYPHLAHDIRLTLANTEDVAPGAQG